MSLYIPDAPRPVYTFQINNVDYSSVFGSKQPDSNLTNIIDQLENTTIWIPHVNRPLKHGDVFTLSGSAAIEVKNTYVGLNLELYDLPAVENLSFEQTEDTTTITWNADGLFLTVLELSYDYGVTWGQKYVYAATVSETIFDTAGDALVVRAKHANLEGAYTNSFEYYPNVPVVTTDSMTTGFMANANVEGTVLFPGKLMTEYGFVWATHDNPTIEDNVVIEGTESFTGSFSDNITGLPAPGDEVFVAAYATNAFGTGYGDVLSGVTDLCLAEGTLISLSDGSTKPIEDITYEDTLLVWDFDNGKLSQAKPVWIMKPSTSDKYSLVTFSNGSKLKTITDGKGHRIFNAKKGMFTHMMSNNTPINTPTFTQNNEKIYVSNKEVIEKETKFYNIITHTHINMFANGILTSTGLNNLYPIVDMKFTPIQRISTEPKDFNDIPASLVTGLRLAEQTMPHQDLKNKLNRMIRVQK